MPITVVDSRNTVKNKTNMVPPSSWGLNSSCKLQKINNSNVF